MSEKEARAALKIAAMLVCPYCGGRNTLFELGPGELVKTSTWIHAYPDGRAVCKAAFIHEVLSSEPDLVVLLRILFAKEQDGFAKGADIVCFGAEEIGRIIERLFGVRLTDDDGWEWVEEQGGN